MTETRDFDHLGGIKPCVGDHFIPMAESELDEFEQIIDAKVPDSYRKFLSTYGASSFKGSPDSPFVYYPSLTRLPSHITGNGIALFESFYGGMRHENDPYSLKIKRNFFLGRMPSSIVPIGDDMGAGEICLGIHSSERGKIFYWDQANEPLDEEDYLEDYGVPRPPEAFFQNVYLVANSFDEFLRSLRLSPE